MTVQKGKFFGGTALKTPWPEGNALLAAGVAPVDFVPEQVVLPMRQSIGAPCEPMVAEGDRVALGQLVGDTQSFVGAKIHASVSGEVVAVENRPLAMGGEGLAVVIQNDGQNRVREGIGPPPALAQMAPADIVALAQSIGLAGMGGATFPTHVKLAVKDTPVDTLLINGAECEPLLAADDALMRSEGEKILLGARAMQKAVGAGRVILCVEQNKPQAIGAMEGLCAGQGDISVLALATRYPQGGEKQLIQSALGRQVPVGGLPSAVGVVVSNAATAAALGEALRTGMPVTHRICTVTGDVATPQNLRFPLGSLACDLIAFCGGFAGAPARVVAGGPMMGVALDRLDVPLTKGSNGLVVFGTDKKLPPGESPCIRCNRCAEACPVRLLPLLIDRAARKEDLARCASLQAESCIDCGCCSYVCPAKRRLAETIWAAKGKLAQRRKEAKA